MDYRGRLLRARNALEQSRLDALLITHPANIRYLCGFSGSAGVLALGGAAPVLFTDGRYTEQARGEVRGARIKIAKGKSALLAAAEWLAAQCRRGRLAIESAHMTVADRA